MLLGWTRFLVVEGLSVHVGNLAEVPRIVEIEGLVLALALSRYSFVEHRLLLLGTGIEEIRIEGFRMIGLIFVYVVELVELEAVPVDEVVDYVL